MTGLTISRIASLLIVLPLALYVAGCGDDDGPTEPENKTYVIKPDGTGDFATIMDAVSAAEDGDVIELLDGTYRGEGNRDIEYLGKEITIRSQSGNALDCIIDCQASLSDPHRGFLITQGVGTDAVLEGVMVINGVQCASCDEFALTDSELHDLSGGGIKIQGASPTIRNCIVRDCQTEFTGGGISIEIDSFPIVIGCVFAGNSATQQGGGITLEFSSEPIIIDCIVEGNTAQRGGGVACTQTSNGTFDDCVITGNVAIEGAGFYASGSSPVLTSVTLSGNRSSQLGGGVSSVAGASPEMRQSVVWGNCALGDGESGNELYIDILSDLSLACCALDSSGVGGSGQPTYRGNNIFSDPLFCDPLSCLAAPTDEADHRLESQSPCLPEVSPCGLLIGALGGPCTPIVVPGLFRGLGGRR